MVNLEKYEICFIGADGRAFDVEIEERSIELAVRSVKKFWNVVAVFMVNGRVFVDRPDSSNFKPLAEGERV